MANNIYIFFRSGIGNAWFYILLIVGITVIFYIILTLLWWKTDWLVNVLAGRVSNHELIITSSNLDLFRVAIRILGLYLLVDSIALLIGLIGYHFSLPPQYLDLAIETHANEIKNFFVLGTKIVLGAILLLGFKNIFKTVDRIDDKFHLANGGQENTNPEKQ
jgi:hypothetical protein